MAELEFTVGITPESREGLNRAIESGKKMSEACTRLREAMQGCLDAMELFKVECGEISIEIATGKVEES